MTSLPPPRSATHTIFGFRKLPPPAARFVMPFLLSVFMSGLVSAVSTARATGPVPGFLRIWLGAWALSWIVAFPAVLVTLPVVRRLTAALVRTD